MTRIIRATYGASPDRTHRLDGPTSIAEFIGERQAAVGYERIAYTTKAQKHEHGPWVRYEWAIWLPAIPDPVSRGIDTVELDDEGKLRQIVSFMGHLEPIPH